MHVSAVPRSYNLGTQSATHLWVVERLGAQNAPRASRCAPGLWWCRTPLLATLPLDSSIGNLW